MWPALSCTRTSFNAVKTRSHRMINHPLSKWDLRSQSYQTSLIYKAARGLIKLYSSVCLVERKWLTVPFALEDLVEEHALYIWSYSLQSVIQCFFSRCSSWIQEISQSVLDGLWQVSLSHGVSSRGYCFHGDFPIVGLDDSQPSSVELKVSSVCESDCELTHQVFPQLVQFSHFILWTYLLFVIKSLCDNYNGFHYIQISAYMRIEVKQKCISQKCS